MAPDQSAQRLSTLLHTLEARGYQCRGLHYRKLWQGAVERRFPAHQENGVWHYWPDDTPAIAAAYGLPRITQEQTEPADAA